MTTHPTINIAILDDHQIILDGLDLLLQNETYLNVRYKSTNGYELIKYLDQHPDTIDVLIMDLMMPGIDGYEMALLLAKQHPAIRIIILSMNTDVDMTYNLIEKTDIKAYLPKSTNKNILLEAIRSVYDHHLYIHETILNELRGYKVKIYEQERLMLSPRELEIVQLICKGLSNKEIAAALYLSEHTIATHRRNIYKKTDAHNSAMLVELASRLKII